MRARTKPPDHTKANGVHYTPLVLASFLAEVTAAAARGLTGQIRVLDPACGDGGLLLAMAKAVRNSVRRRMILEGFETDGQELAKAEAALGVLNEANITLHNRDFLTEGDFDAFLEPRSLFDEQRTIERYDVVIANPPYVRTQVMGAKRAQALARKFGLTGRVDLYHAFAMGMTAVLRPGGVIGLLTSNRFLTIKSGAALRELFSSRFEIEAIYDLGDTKLFAAAVLPVILVARKGKGKTTSGRAFHRIYEHRNAAELSPPKSGSILAALRDTKLSGVIATPEGAFHIQRGKLAEQAYAWSLSNAETKDWLGIVARNQAVAFGDLAKVRVGIKSTADEVFVRDDWETLPKDMRPEAALVRPLYTHREAARWLPKADPPKRVLYPHVEENGRRFPVNLAEYPMASAYFEQHRDRLMRRKYVIDGGRQWYELWVPHNPGDWIKPKIAYPDISEHPKFFFDNSGAIIQGDCYWITLNDGVEPEWLFLMLGVANSTFITKYYDAVFHNKLYSGRRRFMTQYVAKFPLPDLRLATSRKIISQVSKLLKAGVATDSAERKINGLVWESFGLTEEIPWQRNL